MGHLNIIASSIARFLDFVVNPLQNHNVFLFSFTFNGIDKRA